jgi:hypothetical protein
VNALDSLLQGVSQTLATQAGTNLYQAGVDAAQGLIDGLVSQQSGIRVAMEKIANEMVRAIKKALKIRSPSEAFAEIGKFSMQGMAAGFSKSANVVTGAIDDAADNALVAMKKSMRKISDLVTDEIDPNPTITPVLDLTQIKKDAQKLAALSNTAFVSSKQAAAISAGQTTAQAEQEAAASSGTSVIFEQNNYSPEALREIEIYRQTRNQLSQIKSALAVT